MYAKILKQKNENKTIQNHKIICQKSANLSSFILIGVDVVKRMVGFSFHFVGFKLVILIDSFSDVFQSSIFCPIVQNDGFSLGLHLLSKEFIFLFFKFILKFFFSSLLLLFFEDLSFLILIHAFPVVGFDSISVQFRLTGSLK